MARIRTIKPDFFRHLGLFKLEQETGLPLRVAFAGLWTSADREGRFKWEPEALKLDALPFDQVDFSRVLDALATRQHIVKYASDGREYGYIPSWVDHQVLNNRETGSVLPDPEKSSIISTTSTREPRVSHASGTRDQSRQGEGKGREGNSTRETTRRQTKKCPQDFEITEELRKWAMVNASGLDIESETEKLKDHTFASARSDWDGTWRNWMRRASEGKGGRQNGHGSRDIFEGAI